MENIQEKYACLAMAVHGDEFGKFLLGLVVVKWNFNVIVSSFAEIHIWAETWVACLSESILMVYIIFAHLKLALSHVHSNTHTIFNMRLL